MFSYSNYKNAMMMNLEMVLKTLLRKCGFVDAINKYFYR